MLRAATLRALADLAWNGLRVGLSGRAQASCGMNMYFKHQKLSVIKSQVSRVSWRRSILSVIEPQQQKNPKETAQHQRAHTRTQKKEKNRCHLEQKSKEDRRQDIPGSLEALPPTENPACGPGGVLELLLRLRPGLVAAPQRLPKLFRALPGFAPRSVRSPGFTTSRRLVRVAWEFLRSFGFLQVCLKFSKATLPGTSSHLPDACACMTPD